jgi:hypothetical protein
VPTACMCGSEVTAKPGDTDNPGMVSSPALAPSAPTSAISSRQTSPNQQTMFIVRPPPMITCVILILWITRVTALGSKVSLSLSAPKRRVQAPEEVPNPGTLSSVAEAPALVKWPAK